MANQYEFQQMNEMLVEIRFFPNSKVLDYRGTWAEIVASHMDLSEWQIGENRIDVFDKGRTRRAFVSFRNSGFVVANSPTRNYFPDHASKFLKYMSQQSGFGDPLKVQRIGLRTRFGTSFNGPMSELVSRQLSRYLGLSEKAKQIFPGEPIDIAAPLNFETAGVSLRTHVGPTNAKEISQYFDFGEDEAPEVSLFTDVDWYMKTSEPMGMTEILSRVRDFADRGWDISHRIIDLIVGD